MRSRRFGIRSAFRRLIYTGNGIQAAGIADVRQALGYYADEERFIVAQIHVALGVAGELWLAATLRRDLEKAV